MKLSELKNIIMECLEEVDLDEGTRRLDRLVNSKAHSSRSPEVRKKADKDFDTAINKLRRRNKRYEEKHGQVKLANARFQRGPVKESDLEESGPARRDRRARGVQYKDALGDPLNTPLKYRGEFKMGVRPTSSQYASKRITNPRKGKLGSSEEYYPRKIRGSFKKIGKLGEEKKYHTEPPKTGFNRTEPMAYKKKSLSGKIMGGIRKIEKKMRVESSEDKKYPKVGVRQDLKRGQPLRISSPTGQKLKWDNKNRKWVNEGPARDYRRKHGKIKDLTRDPLTLPNRKRGNKVGRGNETLFAKQPPYDKKEKPPRARYFYNVEKYKGDFKKLGKNEIK